MRKDLQSAYELASENHDLDFYKEVLQQFQEELVAKEEAQKARKNKASMIDEMDIESVDRATPVKKSKKRKADDDVAVSAPNTPSAATPTVLKLANQSAQTPQRSDSVKKPKIKLTGSSAKAAANGAATSKTTKDQSASKSKAKRSVEKQGTPVAKRAEMTPKERHERRVVGLQQSFWLQLRRAN